MYSLFCKKMESSKINVSFKFSKTTIKPKIVNNNDNSDELRENKDFVTAVDKQKIESSSTESQSKPKNLVIPLIKKNNWRIRENSRNGHGLSGRDAKIEEMAVQELLRESSEQNDQWESRDATRQGITIPLMMQNQVPEGFETEDRMDVSLRPDQSSLEDYEQVPVEEYGLAMLRGMGWKEGEAIGGLNKGFVKPIEVQLRPKGLGLGADTAAFQKAQKKSSKDEKLQLVKGAFVHIIQGSDKGFYGQVLGLDEENARAIVKLHGGGENKTVTFPEFYLCVVSKKEFDKESRIINRASYESYKDKHDVKTDSQKSREQAENDGQSSRSREEDFSKKKSESSKSHKHSKKRKHSNERSYADHDHSSKNISKKVKSWVRSQLRVRFIDEKYKRGQYFNKKMVVFDVLSSSSCSCKTEDGKYLDDISPEMLETVVPRDESAYIMIVQGKYSGELCTILKRDKTNCIATVQFLSDRNRVEKVEYDSICEYTGDVEQFD